jgi:hypothetical protein
MRHASTGTRHAWRPGLDWHSFLPLVSWQQLRGLLRGPLASPSRLPDPPDRQQITPGFEPEKREQSRLPGGEVAGRDPGRLRPAAPAALWPGRDGAPGGGPGSPTAPVGSGAIPDWLVLDTVGSISAVAPQLQPDGLRPWVAAQYHEYGVPPLPFMTAGRRSSAVRRLGRRLLGMAAPLTPRQTGVSAGRRPRERRARTRRPAARRPAAHRPWRPAQVAEKRPAVLVVSSPRWRAGGTLASGVQSGRRATRRHPARKRRPKEPA